MSNRRRPSPQHRPSPRENERQELEAIWEENRKRRKAGRWSPTQHDFECLGRGPRETDDLCPPDFYDEQGNLITIAQHFAKLRARVESWNKGMPDKKAKEISGETVMGVLEMASMLTNDPAYEAAMQAMRRHRLDAGGLRRGFLDLFDRLETPLEVSCVLSFDPEPDLVTRYIEEYGCSVRQAVEHVVAYLGIPGSFETVITFETVVRKVFDNYARREEIEAEHQQYLNDLNGLED